MNLQQSIVHCLRNYSNFRGRASRPEFWWFVLASFLVGLAAGTVDAQFKIELFNPLLDIATILPVLAVSARRLHDLGWSGWWLLALPTGVGALGLLLVMAMRGEQGPNAYGSPPASAPSTAPDVEVSAA